MKRFILSALFVLCASVAQAQQGGYYGGWSNGYSYQGGYFQPYGGPTYYGYQAYPTPYYGYGQSGPYGGYYQSSPAGASWWNGVGGGSISVYQPINRGYHGRGW